LLRITDNKEEYRGFVDEWKEMKKIAGGVAAFGGGRFASMKEAFSRLC
jgi:hypothetical protein